jgi:ribonuclease-3
LTNSIVKSPVENLGLSKAILNEAFLHGSLDQNQSFERLEFLGDSLIEASVTSMLFKSFPELDEGTLSRWRSALVNQKTLSEISNSLSLKEHLKAHDDQLKTLKENQRIQASLFESLCGALFIEFGFQKTYNFVEENIKPYFLKVDEHFKEADPKTTLQELSQKQFKITPKYIKEESSGPAHAPNFKISVWLDEKKISSAEGASIKQAEQLGARLAIVELEKDLSKTQETE